MKVFLQKILKKQHSQIQKALKDNIENNIEQLNKYAVYNIVMSKLFPRIKFLDKNKDLDFSREKWYYLSLCFQTCNLKYNQGEKLSCGDKQKWIVKNIARLKSDKGSAMRKAFYGK